ncbi:Trp biosynthesis-associated membrane protein [Rothia nasimurium]|uniref:Trp biosynthesis-associated membrane protein n=1 Tax=Rothia nasimurium TaxID=85336 RepID=UPI001F339522|nr:Trp biosynthesis-associated membrane protein [Rothia nasimurium]
MSESQTQPAEVATAHPVPGWAKPARVMLGAMAVSTAAFLTTLPTWIRAEVSTVVSTSTLDISGADAGSTVSALALVALVASVALRIAGPKLRKVLALLLVGVGVGLAVAAFGVHADPQAASMAQVSAITGTNAPADSYEVTVLPLLSAVFGVLVALAGVWAFVATSHWKTGRKYDRSAARAARLASAEETDEIDAWDSLSEGKDPTQD